MESSIFVLGFLLFLSFSTCTAVNSNLFREYIGAESHVVRFSDVPINSDVEFHFILAFAIDCSSTRSTPLPTNGKFNIFWEKNNLGPSDVASIKNHHRNVKIAVSLGGDTVGEDSVGSDSMGHNYVYFQPQSISSWVQNAVSSLTKIIKQYNIDGIDIDYEHFHADPDMFAECIGQLVTTLKNNSVISFASIAPFDDRGPVQSHYLALWSKYGHVIDYVNFQFYAYDMGISVSEFVGYVDKQVANYKGGKVLVSFISDGSGGLGPHDGFFEACNQLKKQGKLEGIFVWSADDSQKFGFRYEKQSQELLGSA